MTFDPYLNRDYGAATTSVQLTESTAFKKSLEAKGESRAEVYDWHITKLDSSQIMTMTEVAGIMERLYASAQASYALPSNSGWGADEHRQCLVDGDEAYRRLTHSHPRLFLSLTEPTVPPEKLYHIRQMIGIKQGHTEREADVAEQQRDISAYFRRHFVRPALPGEEEAAISGGRGYRAEMVSGPPRPGPGC